MRDDWYLTTIAKVCDKSSNIKWQNHLNEDFEYIDLSSVSRENLNITETTTINSENAPSRAKKIVLKNDVIFATTRPTLRRATIINQNYDNQICSTGYAVLRPIKAIVDGGYIYYFLLSEEFMQRMESLQRGASYPAVSEKDVLQTKLYLPKSLSEQKQIVAILDQAFTAIDQAKANIEKNIVNAKELFQSKLNDIFSQKGDGWEEKSLGEVCYVLNGYAFKSKDVIEESNTQLLRMGNLYKNILNLDRKPVFYPDSFNKNHKDYLLKEGDLIMSLTGTVDKTDYGYTVKIPKIDVDLLLNQRIMKIEVHDSNILNKDYLKNYLLSPDFLSRLYDTASGTRQANLSSRTILTLKVNYPQQIDKQLQVVNQFNQLRKHIFKLENQYSKKLKNLEDLKKAILQKAFAGELTEKEVVA